MRSSSLLTDSVLSLLSEVELCSPDAATTALEHVARIAPLLDDRETVIEKVRILVDAQMKANLADMRIYNEIFDAGATCIKALRMAPTKTVKYRATVPRIWFTMVQ